MPGAIPRQDILGPLSDLEFFEVAILIRDILLRDGCPRARAILNTTRVIHSIFRAILQGGCPHFIGETQAQQREGDPGSAKGRGSRLRRGKGLSGLAKGSQPRLSKGQGKQAM